MVITMERSERRNRSTVEIGNLNNVLYRIYGTSEWNISKVKEEFKHIVK